MNSKSFGFYYFLKTKFYFNIKAKFFYKEHFKNLKVPYLFIHYILQISIDLTKENSFKWKRQEVDDISQKLWQMQTTHMI